MKYGKIVCGALRVPQNYPGYIIVDGKKIINPTDEQMLQAGYLPIEEHQPEDREGFTPEAHYRQEPGKIVQYWEYLPIQPDEPTEEGLTNENI